MEDALAHIRLGLTLDKPISLNPCFNGRCTRTAFESVSHGKLKVLILVLMEDALARI